MKKTLTTLLIACTIYYSNAQEIVNMQVNAKANNDKISKYIYGHLQKTLVAVSMVVFMILLLHYPIKKGFEKM